MEVSDRFSWGQSDYRGEEGKEKAQASLHAKTFVIDRETLFVGTLNLDPRALVHNTEIGIIVSSADLASSVAEKFDEGVLKAAYRLTLYRDAWNDESIRWVLQEEDGEKIFFDEPHVGFWKKLGVGILGLLPIESQL